MEELDVVGQVIAGKVASIFIREKSDKSIELGDLLVAGDDGHDYLLLQVFNLVYGSQIPQLSRELSAGLKLEGYGGNLDFVDPKLRNYVLAEVKAVARVSEAGVRTPKVLPSFFASVRHIKKEDLGFLEKPPHPVFFGHVRSGSKILDVGVYLDGEEMFTHHVFIPATTGRGKSNLVKVILWSILGESKFGILVLDPHDEYYGRNGKGLKDHPDAKGHLKYYSSKPFPGTSTLVVNLKSILPWHLDGIVEFTEAQLDAIHLSYDKHRDEDGEWIVGIVTGEELTGVSPRTLSVLQRKFKTIFGLYGGDRGTVLCRNNAFSESAGESTINEIVQALEGGKVVVIDTSRLTDRAELLIGSIIINELLSRYGNYKAEGTLEKKPVVSVVVEEAPRVLGIDVLENQGDNVYSTVAREGRKFKIGLMAITQLTSVIPTTILTNMNTKIILGNEMATERHAIINSTAQDLTEDERSIASLDKGEAIVSSIFTKFAVPIQIPLFEEYITTKKANDKFTISKEDKLLFR